MSKLNKPAVVRSAIVAAVVGTTTGALAGLLSLPYRAPKLAPAARTRVATVAVPPTTVPSPTVPTTTSPTTTAPMTTGAAPTPAATPARADANRAAVAAPPVPVATKGVAPAARTPAPASKTTVASPPPHADIDDTVDVMQRARVLAQKPDVKALVALREAAARRAEERGEADSDATKRQLEELDRYLGEARALRLKLDAEEFRKGIAAANRPR